MYEIYLTDLDSKANNGFIPQVDMSATMALVMSAKEESEIAIIKKASNATVDVFSKYLKEQIMDIIDRDKKVQWKCSSSLYDEIYLNLNWDLTCLEYSFGWDS